MCQRRRYSITEFHEQISRFLWLLSRRLKPVLPRVYHEVSRRTTAWQILFQGNGNTDSTSSIPKRTEPAVRFCRQGLQEIAISEHEKCIGYLSQRFPEFKLREEGSHTVLYGSQAVRSGR